jgi:NTE family protein
MTFSGGGTRAAAFSYGVLEELAKTEVYWEGHDRRLLDEVDVISAVSGGSFTAAYYGLFGDSIFFEFEPHFLRKNVQRDLTLRFLNPVNWARLVSPYFGRSEIAAEYYDKHLFRGATFSDLLTTRGPAIIINATDMALGARFGFNQPQFDWICSDLSAFPVSRAVAASSASPILLSPVTLYNYAGRCHYRAPDHLKKAFEVRDWASREYHHAERQVSYLDQNKRRYVHLLDGGLADNLGLRAVLDEVVLAGGAVEILRRPEYSDLRRAVFVVVNAQAAPDSRWNRRKRIPSFRAMIAAASKVPLNRYNFETIALLRANGERWAKEVREARCGRDETGLPTSTTGQQGSVCHGLDFDIVEVSFDALSDEQEREYLKTLPTSFKLPRGAVDRLRAAARRILHESQDFQKLLGDMRSARSSN